MAQAEQPTATLTPDHFVVTADPRTGGLLVRVRFVDAEGKLSSRPQEGERQEYRSAGPVASLTVAGVPYRRDFEYELSPEDADALDGIMRRAYAAMAKEAGVPLASAEDAASA